MKEIKAGKKLDAQQQVYARCVEYEEALKESLQNAKVALDTQEWLNSHIDYSKALNNAPKDIKQSTKDAVREREAMCNELRYVIAKIECQLRELPKVRDWMVDNYEAVVNMDVALNGVLGLDITRERFNELRKD